MGIQGLLSRLKSVSVSDSLGSYENQVVVVDAMSWLHKGCYACARQIALGRNCSQIYLNYMMKRVELLTKHNIKPLVVFDGRRAPVKANTSQNRRDTRQENLEKGLSTYAKANATLDQEKRYKLRQQADQYFQKAVKPTEAIIMNVVNEFRRRKIPFVVAPYEADAQMVWLCKTQQASAIVTEDSDLLVYCTAANVDCPILFKLDEMGQVKILSLSILRLAGISEEKNKFVQNFKKLLDGPSERRMLVQICVLSGCDFLESLPNVGIVTAQKGVLQYAAKDGGYTTVRRLLEHFDSTGKKIPSDYFERFCSAEAIFYHHIVFDSEAQQCCFLVAPDKSFPEMREYVIQNHQAIDRGDTANLQVGSFLGELIEAKLATKIYLGLVNPREPQPAVTQQLPDTRAAAEPLRRRKEARRQDVDISAIYRQYTGSENVKPREFNEEPQVIEIDLTPEKPLAVTRVSPPTAAATAVRRRLLPVYENRAVQPKRMNTAAGSTSRKKKRGSKQEEKRPQQPSITSFFSRK